MYAAHLPGTGVADDFDLNPDANIGFRSVVVPAIVFKRLLVSQRTICMKTRTWSFPAEH